MKSPLILLYHRIADDSIDSQLLCVSPKNFEEQLQLLKKHYRVLPLHDFIDLMNNNKLQPNDVCITFDDGYADNLYKAAPLLQKYDVPATFFITTGMIGSISEVWWDQLEQLFFLGAYQKSAIQIEKGLKSEKWLLNRIENKIEAYDAFCEKLKGYSPKKIYQILDCLSNSIYSRDTHRFLSFEELKSFSTYPQVTLGAHTVNHPRLSILSDEQQLNEIINSKENLESILGDSIHFFSYPYGGNEDFNEKTKDITQKLGFKAGLANTQEDCGSISDYYSIPRRLVRNWSGENLLSWLEATNLEKINMEHESIKLRNQNLLEMLSVNTERGNMNNESVRIFYLQPYSDEYLTSKSYKRLLNQTHDNICISVIDSYKQIPKNIDESYICIQNSGFLASNTMIEDMLACFEDEDFIVGDLNIVNNNGEKFYQSCRVRIEPNFISTKSITSFMFKKDFFGENRKAILEDKRVLLANKFSHINIDFITTTVENWFGFLINEYENIYLYSAGTHSSNLLKEISFNQSKLSTISEIVDKNEMLHGKKVCGKTVISSCDMFEQDGLPILISSASYEEEIYNELILKYDVEKIIPFYRI